MNIAFQKKKIRKNLNFILRLKYGLQSVLVLIIIDCRDVEAIKNDLVVYVSDQVGAVPSLKLHEFILSPINENETIDQNEVIASIKEFLDSIGESRNFAVISRGNTISITSVSGKPIERAPKPTGQMFSCAHCGHVTPYEVVHNMHVRIHYL